MKSIPCPEHEDVVELADDEATALVFIPEQGETPILVNYKANEWQVICVSNGEFITDVCVQWNEEKKRWVEV